MTRRILLERYDEQKYAKVAELADAPDLGSGGAIRGGSSPPFRTNNLGLSTRGAFVLCAQFCALSPRQVEKSLTSPILILPMRALPPEMLFHEL